MLLVEFAGPPGAGKSTLQKRIVQRLQLIEKEKYLTSQEAMMLVSRQRLDKLYRILLNALPYKYALKFSEKLDFRSYMHFEAQNRFLAKWGKSLEALISSPKFNRMSIAERTIVISSFLEVGSYFESIFDQFPKGTVIFFEEGFVQKSFGFISPSTSSIEDKCFLFNYLDNIPIPDLTIHVQADLKSCYSRMVTRSEGLTKRLNKHDKDNILNFLQCSEIHLLTICKWLTEEKDANILKIDNNLNLDSVISNLEQKLKVIFEKN